MYPVVAVVLYLSAVPVILGHHEIHKRMTTREVRRVFGTTHENVPKYTLVNIEVSGIRRRDTQSQREVLIDDGNEVTNLALEPVTDGFLFSSDTPITWANVTKDGVEYNDVPNMMEEIGDLFQDPKTMTSAVISRSRNRRYAVEAYIGSKSLMLRPLPRTVTPFLPTNGSAYLNTSNYHVLFEFKNNLFPPRHHKKIFFNESYSPLELSRKTREIPSTVYPEVLLILDHTIFELFSSDLHFLIKYHMILWNAVSMKYEGLKHPQVKINIARIIIATEAEGTPYIASSMINSVTVDAAEVAVKVGEHLYKQNSTIPLESYDVAMISSSYDLWNDGPVLGSATHGMACYSMPIFERFYGIAVLQELGKFYSKLPAHELGHLIGALDETQPCTSDDGYIMSDDITRLTSNNWDFSECSSDLITKNFKLRGSLDCLVNKPTTEGYILPRVLTVKSLTLDVQCQNVYGTAACVTEENAEEKECVVLYCQNPDNVTECMETHFNPIEGTQCRDPQKVCIKGKCDFL